MIVFVKLLYVATDQRVPGTTGGSVHVDEVARGLAARGHEVHVVALAGKRRTNGHTRPFLLHPSPAFACHRFFRWSARRGIGALLDELSPEAILERYYNFGGEGIRAAHERGIPSLLEVNSPLLDHPGSVKAAVDALLLFRPMRRLREELCRKASALVTPLPAIVPGDVSREKVHRVSWGANVERFSPGVDRKEGLDLPEDAPVVVFSGSFRPWHGADVLVRAAARMVRERASNDAFFLFIGSGPAWRATRALARELGVSERVRFTGAIPHVEMPSHLSWAHIGVAPYQPSRLKQMKLGFYWSPLKIFEYMAMGLPVVTLEVPELREIVRPGTEGLLVPEGDVEATARAIQTLLRDPSGAQAMGRAARERVVAHFSWAKHCEALEGILDRLVGKQ